MSGVAILCALLYLQADAGEDAIREETKTTVTGENNMQQLQQLTSPLIVSKPNTHIPEGSGWKTVEEQENEIAGESPGEKEAASEKEEEQEEQQAAEHHLAAQEDSKLTEVATSALLPLMDNSKWSEKISIL
jgi:hypothetical protein